MSSGKGKRRKSEIPDSNSSQESTEPDSESSDPVAKKPKVTEMVEKESKFNSTTAQLALRIKEYLETNRNRKYIDIDDLARTLYDQYPEYGRKKYKAFKVSVEKTFGNLQSELNNISNLKKKESKSSKKTPPQAPTGDQRPDIVDETPVKRSVNSQITDLYAKSPKTVSLKTREAVTVIDDIGPPANANSSSVSSGDCGGAATNTTSSSKKDKRSASKSSDIDALIEKHEGFANDTVIAIDNTEDSDAAAGDKSVRKGSDSSKNDAKTSDDNHVEVINDDNDDNQGKEEEVSEFDRIKQQTKRAKESMMANGEKKSAKKSRPSKSLMSHLENSRGAAVVIVEGDSRVKRVSVDVENVSVDPEAIPPLLQESGEKSAPDKSPNRTDSSDPTPPLLGTASTKSRKPANNSPRPKTSSGGRKDRGGSTDTIKSDDPRELEAFVAGGGGRKGPASTSPPPVAVSVFTAIDTVEIIDVDMAAPAPSSGPVIEDPRMTGSVSKTPDNISVGGGGKRTESGVTPRYNKSKKRPLPGDEKSSTSKKRKNEIEVQESSVRFSDFGGSEELLCDICKLLAHLRHPELYRQLGVSPPRGFLLHGPPGCGKTLLAHAIVGELGLPFIKVAAPELVSGVSGDSESKIRDLFQQAADTAPCVLFIDEIDCITPKRENAQREMERRIVAQLLTCLDDLGKDEAQVVVIGATNRPDSLDPALRRAGRFDREIGLGIPDRQARHKILEVLCRNLRLDAEVSLQHVASLSPGYVGADLSSLVREAAMAAVNRMFTSLQGNTDLHLEQLLEWLKETPPVSPENLTDLCIKQADWQAALKVVQPSAKREGFATVPGVSWKDVGALANIREELQLSILAPVRFQEEFESLGLSASSGVLLAGPPGCGKTLVAKAIANEAGINFISVKGPELLNMYVGESERAVRACFARARNSSPCVIFFDEIDSLCPRRSGNSSDGGSSSRVVNQLLTEMDGVQARNGVFLMAATNRPDILDPAVLRPGRLDKILFVGFPGPEDRAEILRALTKNGTKPQLGQDVNLVSVGLDPRCDGFTGADMSALVREASMAALKDRIRRINTKDALVITVNRNHFEQAFAKVRPSVDEKDQKKYRAMGEKYSKKTELSSSEDDSQDARGEDQGDYHMTRIEDVSDDQSRRKEDLAGSSSGRKKDSAGSQSRRQEDLADSPSERKKDSAGSQSRRREDLADSPSKRNEDTADSQSRRNEDTTNIQIRRQEDSADSPSRRKEGTTDSQSRRKEDLAGSQRRRQEDLADSPSGRKKDSAGSQSRRREDLGDSQSRRQEDLAGSQGRKMEVSANSPSRRKEDLTGSQSKIREVLANSQGKRRDEPSILDDPYSSQGALGEDKGDSQDTRKEDSSDIQDVRMEDSGGPSKHRKKLARNNRRAMAKRLRREQLALNGSLDNHSDCHSLEVNDKDMDIEDSQLPSRDRPEDQTAVSYLSAVNVNQIADMDLSKSVEQNLSDSSSKDARDNSQPEVRCEEPGDAVEDSGGGDSDKQKKSPQRSSNKSSKDSHSSPCKPPTIQGIDRATKNSKDDNNVLGDASNDAIIEVSDKSDDNVMLPEVLSNGIDSMEPVQLENLEILAGPTQDEQEIEPDLLDVTKEGQLNESAPKEILEVVSGDGEGNSRVGGAKPDEETIDTEENNAAGKTDAGESGDNQEAVDKESEAVQEEESMEIDEAEVNVLTDDESSNNDPKSEGDMYLSAEGKEAEHETDFDKKPPSNKRGSNGSEGSEKGGDKAEDKSEGDADDSNDTTDPDIVEIRVEPEEPLVVELSDDEPSRDDDDDAADEETNNELDDRDKGDEEEEAKDVKNSKGQKRKGSVENKILDFLNNETVSETDGKDVDGVDDDSSVASSKNDGTTSCDPDKLRFLPGMLIRVVDTSKVPSAAGRTGTVKNIRKNNKVTVSLEGLSQRIVHSSELEPFMPEDGDKVKLLIPGSSEQVGEVVNMNDQDICEVKIDGYTDYIVIDNLCKINK